MTDHYAVMGSPIAHSLSPRLHALFAAETGQSMLYDRLEVRPERFDAAVGAFFAAGGKGLNITVPHKQAAYALTAAPSIAARGCGAVNTLWREGDTLCGDNTDGIGLLHDLIDHLGIDLSGARLLLIGAGGAARGALPALCHHAPEQIVVTNRNLHRAHALLAGTNAGKDDRAIIIRSLESLASERFDLIINATSAGLSGAVPAIPAATIQGAFCYDMTYGATPTRFMRWALEAGAIAVQDGLGMLVEQAAESFLLWRGIRPSTESARLALRHYLAHPESSAPDLSPDSKSRAK